MAAQKRSLRAAAQAARASADPGASAALVAMALTRIAFAGTIAGVWPLPGEVDLRPLLAALHARGHPIVLPQTPPRGQPLAFRFWTPGCAMVREPFGTWRPDGALGTPDMLLVPLLAFDRAGRRLGYGGGYYDRTLAALAGTPAIGFGFACQEVACVPVEPHDRLLSGVVTEQAFLDLAGGLTLASSPTAILPP